MSLCISIRFLTGRAHLHHWHAHHSDGKVDWPPSPWRLLRALVAVAGTGMTSLPEPLDEQIADTLDDALPVSRLASLLAALAAPPKIWLPRTGGGHTRQFLPKEFKSTGSAVFDTFATVSKETPIVFEWPDVVLDPDDQRFTDLQTLLRRLTYFGRAESWCDATVQAGRPSAVKTEVTHWCCDSVEPSVKSSGREYVDYTLERKLAPCSPLIAESDRPSLAADATSLLTRIKGAGGNEDSVGIEKQEFLSKFPMNEFDGRLTIRPAPAKPEQSEADEGSTTPKAKTKLWLLVAIGSWDDIERDALLKHPALKGDEMKPAKKALSDVLKKRVTATRANRAWSDELARNAQSSNGGVLLLRCLLRSSGEDIKAGLERPAGSRWVHYTVPRAIYQVPNDVSRKPAQSRANSSPITLVRFALNTATVNRPVLPPLTDTLLVADKFRSAALAWHGHLKLSEHPRNLCGREDDSSRVVGHDHAYFWPMDEDGDGFIDHVSVYCRRSFHPVELDALRRLLRLKQRGGRPDLLVTMIFMGHEDQLWPADRMATKFVSAVPYFCPVHLSHGKSGGGRVRSLVPILLNTLREQGIVSENEASPEFQEVGYSNEDAANPFLKHPDEPWPQNGSIITSGILLKKEGRIIRSLDFCRRRKNHQVSGSGRCLEIRFSEPKSVRPFSIGAQSHFGLGLFVPVV